MRSTNPKIPGPSPRPGALEVEVKLPVDDLTAALGRIRAAGYQEIESRSFEANVLYDTEAQELRGKQQALRIREYRGEAILTFKGKPLAGKHKQREELETTVGDARVIATVLERLGYQPVFRYEKFRSVFGKAEEAGVITVDETPLGTFLELEGDAAWIDATAHALGYAAGDYITASYATIYVEHCRRNGIVPTHFVFESPANEARTQ